MTCDSLLTVLRPAYSPCAGFEGACRHVCTWAPEKGLVPRGFAGANGQPKDVRLVIVTAEPGPPGDEETYRGGPNEIPEQHVRLVEGLLTPGARLARRDAPTPFHANLRLILQYCWPGRSLQEQLKLTWLTQSVLCTLSDSASEVVLHRIAETCTERYLRRQIELLPNAFVLALGGKAKSRLDEAGVRIDATAQHPSARPNTDPNTTWRDAARRFRLWLGETVDSDVAPKVEQARLGMHQLSGRFSVVKRASLERKAQNKVDPRWEFYHAILSSSTYEEYYRKVGLKVVTVESYTKGNINADMEIKYARKNGWISNA